MSVADELRALGVRGIVITAAEQGKIEKLACAMPECLCPEELGGAGYFEPVPETLPDWMPTQDHIDLKSAGGHLTVDNVRLAHRLCNRVDYAKNHGKPYEKDRARVEAARLKAIDRTEEMAVSQFEVAVGSPPDRDRLQAEIMCDHEQWAEIHQKSDSLTIEFYPRRDGAPWVFNFNEAHAALADARDRLVNYAPRESPLLNGSESGEGVL